jgi:NADH:ubiquinone oxidoreductase subunit H
MFNFKIFSKNSTMLYFPIIMSILEVLAITVPVLLTVAFITIAERKTMASMQRRLGPNAVG